MKKVMFVLSQLKWQGKVTRNEGMKVRKLSERNAKRKHLRAMLSLWKRKSALRQFKLKYNWRLAEAFFGEMQRLRRQNLILKFFRLKKVRLYFNRVKAFMLASQKRKLTIGKAFYSIQQQVISTNAILRTFLLKRTIKAWSKQALVEK